MTDLHDFEARLRLDINRVAQTFTPATGAVDRAIETARSPRPTHSLQPSRARRWVLPLAAAATVLIIVSVMALVVQTSRHNAPAGPSVSPVPSLRSSPTSTTRPLIVDGVHPATCQVPDQSPFASVFRQVLTTAPGGGYDIAGLPILSITPDGDVLAGTSGPVANPGRLDLIRPDGSRTTLYRASNVPLGINQSASVDSAQGDTRWIVFSVAVGQGQSTVTRLAVVDRASGAVTTIRMLPSNSSTIILPPVLFDGQAYWTEVDASGTGAVFRYDPTTANTATVDSGSGLGTPTLIGGGLYWQRAGHLTTYRKGQVPAGFPLGGAKFPKLVSDGTTSVWATTADVSGSIRIHLELSKLDMKQPMIIEDVPADGFLNPLAVTGPYVLWDNGRQLIALDTRTGATGRLGDSNPGISAATAASGTVAMNQVGSKGGPQLSLARLANLPELRC